MAVESILRAKVDTPVLEIGIELLLCLPVLKVELVQVVVCGVERLQVPLGPDNPHFSIGDGIIQQPVAHEVHQPVRVHTLAILRKKLRVFLDERNDIVFFLSGRLETAFSLLRYDEFVAPYASSLAVHADE